MKKVIPYGLVVLLIIALAYPMIYSLRTIVKRSLHKREMFQKMERSPLDSITLAVSTVRWFEKDREIIVNNCMFDVVSWKMVGDSAIFHGLWDDKETALNKIIRKAAEKKKEQQSVYKFQKLISNWTVSEQKNKPDSLIQPAPLNYTGYIKDRLQKIVLSLPKPPPELS